MHSFHDERRGVWGEKQKWILEAEYKPQNIRVKHYFSGLEVRVAILVHQVSELVHCAVTRQ
jgi:hypothetical protein